MNIKPEVKFKLVSLSFQITNRCNLKCDFCSRESGIQDAKMMSIKLIDKVIKEALDFSDLKTINLSGGEPFLHDDLEEILNLISNKYRLDIRINTNGMFFSEKNIEMVRRYNVSKFTVSLDGCSKYTHDLIRGVDGAFDKTIHNLKKLKKYNIQFVIKMTANKNNVSELFDVMKLSEELGAYGFSFSRTIPIGRAKDKDLDVKEFREEYFYYGKKCSEYAKHSNVKLIIDDPLRFQFDVRAIEKLEKGDMDISKVWGGCTAGQTYLYILINGDIVPCTALVKSLGNVHVSSIKDIWYNAELLQKLRTKKFLKNKCGICENKYLCGGCRAYALALTGDEFREDTFCELCK